MEEQRSALEISPDRVIKIWNEWQLQVLVLLSLALQIGLLLIGPRRKCSTSNWVRGLAWAMYLSADTVAALALGILSNIEQEDITSSSGTTADQRSVIVAVWASFLLLHLGGPDTITAYSLEDNDLWLRHLLRLVVQVGGAFYVLVKSQVHDHHFELLFFAVPIFVAGIIKYGERSWALRSASRIRLKNSLYQAPKMADTFKLASNKGPWYTKPHSGCVKREDAILGSYHLHEAFRLFEFLRDVYGDVPLDKDDQDESYLILQGKSTEEAFQLVDIELGFLYDMIYTKAPIIWYNRFGFFLRIIAFLSSISALLMFCLIIDKKPYSNIDTSITYLFVFGAAFQEIYSFILIIISDWSMILLSGSKKQWAKCVYQAISSSRLASTNDHKIRWSGSIGQINLDVLSIEGPSMFFAPVPKFFGIYDMVIKKFCTTREEVSVELKEMIFQQLREKRENALVPNDIEKICSWRGDGVLQKYGCFNKFDWSIVEVDFVYSIIVWHVATNICHDFGKIKAEFQRDFDRLYLETEMSGYLSNYMIYLLFVNPFMLPKGNGLVTFLETLVETIINYPSIFESMTTDGRESFSFGALKEGKRSALLDGYKLAKGLQSLETDEEGQRWTSGKKWEMITQVWVEMLSYAASHCEWKDHAKQLRRGGEFLTHVSVLMSHLGYISGQSQSPNQISSHHHDVPI